MRSKILLKPSPPLAGLSKVLPERAAGQLVRLVAAQACCEPGRALKNARVFGNAGRDRFSKLLFQIFFRTHKTLHD